MRARAAIFLSRLIVLGSLGRRHFKLDREPGMIHLLSRLPVGGGQRFKTCTLFRISLRCSSGQKFQRKREIPVTRGHNTITISLNAPEVVYKNYMDRCVRQARMSVRVSIRFPELPPRIGVALEGDYALTMELEHETHIDGGRIDGLFRRGAGVWPNGRRRPCGHDCRRTATTNGDQRVRREGAGSRGPVRGKSCSWNQSSGRCGIANGPICLGSEVLEISLRVFE